MPSGQNTTPALNVSCTGGSCGGSSYGQLIGAFTGTSGQGAAVAYSLNNPTAVHHGFRRSRIQEVTTCLPYQPAPNESAGLVEISSKLAFTKKLQAVTNKIHSTSNIDEIMLELSADICALFDADRLTIYATGEDGNSIVSKVKTGLTGFKDLKLPISPASIAGYVASHRQVRQHRRCLRRAGAGQLQPANPLPQGSRPENRLSHQADAGRADPGRRRGTARRRSADQLPDRAAVLPAAVEGVGELAKTLAIAFEVRRKPQPGIKTKFDYLVSENLISAQELDLATRSARKKSKNIEDVLVDEFQVKLSDLGKSIASFFGVPYEPFRADRIKPMDLLKNLKREYVENTCGCPSRKRRKGW